jgi:hypothetical protein
MNNIAREEEQAELEPIRQLLGEIAEEQQSAGLQEAATMTKRKNDLCTQQRSLTKSLRKMSH